MSIWDFLKQDEINEAPEGEQGFLELVRVAQNRLNEQIGHYDEDNQQGIIQDIQSSFSMLVLDLGKSFEVEPFASMQVADETFGPNEYRAFRRTLDSYVAQLVVNTANASKRNSLVLTADLKAKIRTHLHHIREYLDNENIPDTKRATLNRKLAEFEAALDKNRFDYRDVGTLAMTILTLTTGGLALADSGTLRKLLTGMMQAVAEAKSQDDERRNLPAPDAPTVMLPARREEPKVQGAAEDFSADLDDEIPF